MEKYYVKILFIILWYLKGLSFMQTQVIIVLV